MLGMWKLFSFSPQSRGEKVNKKGNNDCLKRTAFRKLCETTKAAIRAIVCSRWLLFLVVSTLCELCKQKIQFSIQTSANKKSHTHASASDALNLASSAVNSQGKFSSLQMQPGTALA